MMNIYRALHHTTEISPNILYLNDTAHAKLQHKVQITNVGAHAQTYTIAHEAANTVLSMNVDTDFWQPFPVPSNTVAATADVYPARLSLEPGQNSTITVTFTPPVLDPSTVPIFSGWISIASSEDTELGSVRVPYFGVGASMANEKVIDLGAHVLGTSSPYLGDADGNPIQNDTTTFTLAKRDEDYDSPMIIARFRLGVRRVTIDLVNANITFQPTLPIDGSLRISDFGSADSADAQAFSTLKRRDSTFDEVPIVGRIYEASDVSRSGSDGSWRAALEDTVTDVVSRSDIPVPDGRYRILLRASRFFSEDLAREESYESYLTHAFQIKRAD